MNIKSGRDEQGMMVIAFPDECKENVVNIIEQVNKSVEIDNAKKIASDENKTKMLNIIFTGLIGIVGALKLEDIIKTVINSNSEEIKMDEENLRNMIKLSCSSNSNSEQLINDAICSIDKLKNGTIKEFEVAGIKVKSYNPEEKYFIVA